MAKRLVPCSACARHVRVTESLCPFCGSVMLPRRLEQEPLPEPPPAGVSRAGLLAYRAVAAKAVAGAALLAAAACDSPPLATAYGGPPPMSSQGAATLDAASGVDAGSAMSSEVYGGPPPDATPPDAAKAIKAPAYGGPPPNIHVPATKP
jgi:hypothetical protein